MTWSAAGALAGLVLLPVAWWIHRHRRRSAPVEIPSLLFLQEEIDAPPPRRRWIDAELFLTLAALGLLVLAAAGPGLVRRPARRTLHVVVSGGAPASARGHGARVDQTLAKLGSALDAVDQLSVSRVPSSTSAFLPRPSAGALVGAALASDAAWRAVLSDEAASERTPGVSWFAVGRPEARNVGIVAATTAESEDGTLSVFVNVVSSGPEPATVGLELRSGGLVLGASTLEVPADAYASTTVELGERPLVLELVLVGRDGNAWSDDLPADDHVVFTAEPLRVHVDDSLPARHVEIVRRALAAALGSGGFVRSDASSARLVVSSGGGDRGNETDRPLVLVLHPLPPGESGVRAETAPDVGTADPLALDLSTHGIDLRYATSAVRLAPGLEGVFAREGSTRWPVLARRGREVHLMPDPAAGVPAPADRPFWPLLVDNLVGEAGGAREPGGYRRRGLLDAPSSRLGRSTDPFDAARIAAQPQDRSAEVTPLRPTLTLLCLTALALLWVRPWLRRSRRRTRRGRHHEPSPPVVSTS